MDGQHELMTTAEAAQALRHSPATVKEWGTRGTGPLKPVKIGRRVFWRRSDVQHLLGGEL